MNSAEAQLEWMKCFTPLEVAVVNTAGTVADYVDSDGEFNVAIPRWCESYDLIRQHIIDRHTEFAVERTDT